MYSDAPTWIRTNAEPIEDLFESLREEFDMALERRLDSPFYDNPILTIQTREMNFDFLITDGGIIPPDPYGFCKFDKRETLVNDFQQILRNFRDDAQAASEKVGVDLTPYGAFVATNIERIFNFAKLEDIPFKTEQVAENVLVLDPWFSRPSYLKLGGIHYTRQIHADLDEILKFWAVLTAKKDRQFLLLVED